MLSLGALVVAGAFVVGTSLPANAFYDPSVTPLAASVNSTDTSSAQGLNVEGDAKLAVTSRDDYSVKSWAQLLAAKYSKGYTIGHGAIRWPFPYFVPITDGYGPRVAPCGGCSTFHYGVDFVPGAGAPIYTIAAGVVIKHDDNDPSYGDFVEIEHHIGGHVITSLYAHMPHGASALVVGQKVTVGQFVGIVGETGEATGPHLHLEISVDGVRIDPYAWLVAHVR